MPSVCPVAPAHTSAYVGFSLCPPVYPTRVYFTPGSFSYDASGPQNHPKAKTANSHPSGTLNPSPVDVRAAAVAEDFVRTLRAACVDAIVRDACASGAAAARIARRVMRREGAKTSSTRRERVLHYSQRCRPRWMEECGTKRSSRVRDVRGGSLTRGGLVHHRDGPIGKLGVPVTHAVMFELSVLVVELLPRVR